LDDDEDGGEVGRCGKKTKLKLRGEAKWAHSLTSLPLFHRENELQHTDISRLYSGILKRFFFINYRNQINILLSIQIMQKIIDKYLFLQ